MVPSEIQTAEHSFLLRHNAEKTTSMPKTDFIRHMEINIKSESCHAKNVVALCTVKWAFA